MSYTLSYKSMTRVVVADSVFLRLFSPVHTLSHHIILHRKRALALRKLAYSLRK